MYAHILRAVWVNASRREVRTVWIELCEVSYSMRWDWILKASEFLVNISSLIGWGCVEGGLLRTEDFAFEALAGISAIFDCEGM